MSLCTLACVVLQPSAAHLLPQHAPRARRQVPWGSDRAARMRAPSYHITGACGPYSTRRDHRRCPPTRPPAPHVTSHLERPVRPEPQLRAVQVPRLQGALPRPAAGVAAEGQVAAAAAPAPDAVLVGARDCGVEVRVVGVVGPQLDVVWQGAQHRPQRVAVVAERLDTCSDARGRVAAAKRVGWGSVGHVCVRAQACRWRMRRPGRKERPGRGRGAWMVMGGAPRQPVHRPMIM